MLLVDQLLPGERTREGNDLYHEMMASGVARPNVSLKGNECLGVSQNRGPPKRLVPLLVFF